MNKVFAVLTVMLFALPLFGQSESMWAPAIVVGTGSRTEVKLLNELDRPRHLILSFYQELGGNDSPFLKVVMDNAEPGNTHKVIVGVREQKTLTVFRPSWKLVSGWMEVRIDRIASKDFAGRPTEPPGPIQGLSGAVTRIVDGEKYASELTRDLNEFRFPVSEIHELKENERVRWTTAVALTNTNTSFPPTILPLGVVYQLIDVKGKTVAEMTCLQPSQTQTSIFLWQIFADTPEKWFKLIGGLRFTGELRVMSGYAPVAAVAVQVPY